jgi:NADH-quinone oxidoreductase subunit G
MSVADLGALDRVLVVGSFLRKDHPLIAHRLRQAAKRGTRVYKLHSADDDWLLPLAGKKIVAPSQLLQEISSMGDFFKDAKNAAILIGNFAQQHPQAAQIHAAAQALGVKVGFLGEAANSVGGYVAGLPAGGNVATALQKKALVFLGAEPELDFADSAAATAAAQKAEFVVVLSAYRTGLEYANLILPIGAFAETAGSFVNAEGRLQSFYATVNPPGEARPAWKVLRVLGSQLGLPGFELDTIEQVRSACLNGREISNLLSNKTSVGMKGSEKPSGIQRIADVPIYFADPLVRRAASLQATADAAPPKAWMNGKLMGRLGLSARDLVRVRQGAGEATLEAALDDRLPDDCVRIAAAHSSVAGLGAMFGSLSLEKAAVGKAA